MIQIYTSKVLSLNWFSVNWVNITCGHVLHGPAGGTRHGKERCAAVATKVRCALPAKQLCGSRTSQCCHYHASPWWGGAPFSPPLPGCHVHVCACTYMWCPLHPALPSPKQPIGSWTFASLQGKTCGFPGFFFFKGENSYFSTANAKPGSLLMISWQSAYKPSKPREPDVTGTNWPSLLGTKHPMMWVWSFL